MKKSFKIISALILSSTMAFGLGATIFATTSKPVSETEAASDYTSASHIASYYSTVSGTGSSLLSSICTKISSPYTSISYSNLKNYYTTTDSRGDGYLFDIYSDSTNYTVSNAGSSASSIGGGWNKEHTIPKSWWGGDETSQGCDIIVVRLSDIHCNSIRSNYLFGEVSSSTDSTIGDNKIGNCSNYSEIGVTSTTKVFEPRDLIKGEMARTYFYAMARYYTSGAGNGAAKNWTTGNGSYIFSSSGNNGFVQKYLNMLLRWHREYPVSQREITRNGNVESCQSNRNPFIDHPSWVDLIWGGTYPSSGLNYENTSNGTATVANGVISGGSSTSDPTASISGTTIVTVGNSTTLTASLSNVSNASNITWTSSNESFATVVKGTTTTSSSVATVTGVAAGSATIYCKYSGTTIGQVAVTVSSGSSGSSLSSPITITYESFSSTGYSAGFTDTYSSTFAVTDCGNQSSTIQFKKNSGVLYNTAALTNITSIVVTKTDGKSNNLTVYGGTSAQPSTTSISGTTSGNVTTYDFGSYSYPYFKLANGSGASNFDSIVINYNSSGSSTTPTLNSISVNQAPTKTTYTAGEYFDPTGLKLNLVYSDTSYNTTVAYSSSNSSDFTFNPTTSTALTTSHTSVNITYGGKTTSQAITVNASSGSGNIPNSSYTFSSNTTTYNASPSFANVTTNWDSNIFTVNSASGIRVGGSPKGTAGSAGSTDDYYMASGASLEIGLNNTNYIVSKVTINVCHDSDSNPSISCGNLTKTITNKTPMTEYYYYPLSQTFTISVATNRVFVDSIKVDIVAASNEHLAWGTSFLEMTATECAAGQGISSGTWSDCATIFNNNVDSNTQVDILGYTANASGDACAEAVARYDNIIANYNLSDFAARGNDANRMNLFKGTSTNNILLILGSISLLGGLTYLAYFLKKRKED